MFGFQNAIADFWGFLSNFIGLLAILICSSLFRVAEAELLDVLLVIPEVIIHELVGIETCDKSWLKIVVDDVVKRSMIAAIN